MGYLLRGLRLASYLAAALGLILIIGGVMYETRDGGALLFYGIRILFMSLVGISATSWLRDRLLEGTELDEYQSLAPTSDTLIQKVRKIFHIPSWQAHAHYSLISGVIVSLLGLWLPLFTNETILDNVDVYLFGIVCVLIIPAGAILGLLGGFIATWIGTRYLSMTPRETTIVGGILGGLVPVLLINNPPWR